MSYIFSDSSVIDASVWRAIIGTPIEIPPVGSYIYYFPQGHFEQSSSSSNFDDPINNEHDLLLPWIPCNVLSINFLAKTSSDQAYIKMVLQPILLPGHKPTNNDCDAIEDNNVDTISFTKILTQSDVDRSSGLTIPQSVALTILPLLDYTTEFPNQTLMFKDAHNMLWEFQHIYRGTPRRHLLTTGWCKFVVDKHLVHGDSIVLIKKRSTNELFIGIRRAHNAIDRHGHEEVLAAIRASRRQIPFEVTYYPQVKVPMFVVKAKKVIKEIYEQQKVGMKVRMAAVRSDMLGRRWIHGVITANMMPNGGTWWGSPWRILQVSWEDPETTQHMSRVSPWQVECITPTPPIDPHYHPNQSNAQSKSNGDSSTTSFQLFGRAIKMSRADEEGGSSHNKGHTNGGEII